MRAHGIVFLNKMCCYLRTDRCCHVLHDFMQRTVHSLCQIKSWANYKLWFNASLKAKLKTKNGAYRSGDATIFYLGNSQSENHFHQS